jgi:hypothetical protein
MIYPDNDRQRQGKARAESSSPEKCASNPFGFSLQLGPERLKNYTCMNRERDKKLIQVFVDCYNTLGGTDYRVDSYPDEETRNSKNIDALCVDSRRKTLALEHTRLEAFPGEMTDTARFLEVTGQYDKDPALVQPGFQTAASIPVGSIPTGIRWETLSNDIGVFLRNCLPLREGTYTFVQGRVSKLQNWRFLRYRVRF